MTKDQEIKLLDKTIEAFGQASYIGPFLKEHRTALVWAIRNDMPVESALSIIREPR